MKCEKCGSEWTLGMSLEEMPALCPFCKAPLQEGEPARQNASDIAKMVVVGIGGGGNNIANRVVNGKARNLRYIAMDTDVIALRQINADQIIQVGEKLTQGKGAGSNPDMGRMSAEENREQIKEALEGADLVMIAAGMGGGTGTGGAPVVAEIAREAGALVIGFVTMPFRFEGQRRMEQAQAGVEMIRNKADAFISIQNEKLIPSSDSSKALSDILEAGDDMFRQALYSFYYILHKADLATLDYSEAKNLLTNAGSLYMGIGRSSGEYAVMDAVQTAMSGKKQKEAVKTASSVLVNIITKVQTIDVGIIERISSTIKASAQETVQIAFFAATNRKISEDVCVSLIAVGSDVKEPVDDTDTRPAEISGKGHQTFPNVGNNLPRRWRKLLRKVKKLV